jgi:two-component system, cell cycle response regulator DivK
MNRRVSADKSHRRVPFWRPQRVSVPKVLIVEDNELNRDMLSRRLARRGWEVTIAVDGRQACEGAVASAPDLILMDLNLPDMDGWTAATLLKKDRRTARIPVVALTAHAMVGDREKALQAGCDEFEPKPVEISRLLEKMRALVQGRQQDGEQ